MVWKRPAPNQLQKRPPPAAAGGGICRELSGTALLLIVDFLEIGVNDLVVAGAAAASCAGARPRAVAGTGPGAALRPAGFLLRLVHGLAELHRDLGQRLGLGLDLLDVLAAERVLQGLDRALHGLAVGCGELVARLLQTALGGVDQAVGLVPRLDQLAPLLVIGGVRLSVLDHLVDVGFREAARGLDADLLLLAGRLVLGRDVDDAVGVDVERDLDLRHAARRRRDADQVELAQQLVDRRHLALALEDADRDRGLAVLGGREGLALLGWDRRVAIDQPREDAAQGLDAERQRGHVEQQDVLDLALEDAGLDRGADRDDLVRVDPAMRLAAEELLHGLDDLWHARHAADQDHLVDLRSLDPGVAQRGAARIDRLLDQIVDQLLELRAGELDVEVLRPVLVGGDERKVDLGLHRRRQLDLRLLGGLLEALQGELVAAQVDALLLPELLGEVIDDLLVEILAAEERVAVGRFDLEHAIADLEDRDVERAAAEIVDRDHAGALLL